MAVPRKLASVDAASGCSTLEKAGVLIRKEMSRLLAHDIVVFPIVDGKKEKKRAIEDAVSVALEPLEDAELAKACALVEAEVVLTRDASSTVELAAFATAWEEAHADLAWLPDRSYYGPLGKAPRQEKLAALSFEFTTLRGHMEKDANKAGKLEERLGVKTMGYTTRAEDLHERCDSLVTSLEQVSVETLSFGRLAKLEVTALPLRRAELMEAIGGERQRELALQACYAVLVRERNKLSSLVQDQTTSQALPRNS